MNDVEKFAGMVADGFEKIASRFDRDDKRRREMGQFLTVHTVSWHLGVPTKWLSREAAAGALPYIVAGKSVLMNVDQVRRALLERAAANVTQARSSDASASPTQPG